MKELLGRIGLKINPITTLVKNWVISDAAAAPIAPQAGIRHRFSATLAKAPATLIAVKYFCFPSARIQIFRTDP